MQTTLLFVENVSRLSHLLYAMAEAGARFPRAAKETHIPTVIRSLGSQEWYPQHSFGIVAHTMVVCVDHEGALDESIVARPFTKWGMAVSFGPSYERTENGA